MLRSWRASGAARAPSAPSAARTPVSPAADSVWPTFALAPLTATAAPSAAPGEGANAARIAPASHWIEGEEGE